MAAALTRIRRLVRSRVRSGSFALLCLVLLPGGGFNSLRGAQPTLVYTFDARPLNRLDLQVATNAADVWDTIHVIAALQGLANRERPQLYLFYCSGFDVDTDEFWLEWFRGEDGWLRGSELRRLTGIEEAVKTFRAVFRGLVVYDPAVPATSDVASTAGGCDDLLPVRLDLRPGSVFDLLVRRMKLPVRLWLVNPDGTSKFTGRGQIPDIREATTGSPKVDAYRWAVQRCLRSGRCAPGVAAYYIDAFWLQHPGGDPAMHTLSNHDYFIARRAFFFDLSPWGDEPPGDDPRQAPGLDRSEFLQIMRALYDRAQGGILQVGGFPPWPYKYTVHATPAGKHEGVPTEWEFGRLISQFNGYMEADAAGLGAMANASFYQHYPLANHYAQPNAKPSPLDWRRCGFVTSDGRVANKLFIGHYAGDYDAPSWLYKAVPNFFRDPARGRVPVGWAFDPNLCRRAPQALAYAYRHATTNDFFIAGDSGAGYLNPRALTVRPDSLLPSGLQAWAGHCVDYYQRWGMTITGFMLDGDAGASTDLEFESYLSFSPDGAGTHFEQGPALHRGLPTCREQDLPGDVEQAAELIATASRGLKARAGFLWARSILRSPGWYAELSRRIADKCPSGDATVVDPYTFFGLIRLQNK
jgi:hypothetical protein